MPTKLTALVAALALVGAVAITGCGGGGDSGGGGGGDKLAAQDNLTVAQDRADIDEFCAVSSVGKGDLFDRALFTVVGSVDELILIYKKHPNQVYVEKLPKKQTLTMKQVTEEASKKLKSCGKDGKTQSAKLTAALQSG